ncbi:hypothetical protein Aph01nite_55720 [Acrocarpospora phusangensis]|uniref:Uncharacterized protein n=1 Tax=Acrocarpospora phusangensis TaxID=1070424 RepID=A0A919QE45_9ACTN|nr:hypothetical protein [Acrocarpospora phusangensis]GIH27262.1 hypothetical protein Aph01nite_55720 [Acrocarpospora phusangensis]
MGNRLAIALVGACAVFTGLYALWARDARPGHAILDLEFLAAHVWACVLTTTLVTVVALVATRWLVATLARRRYGTRHGTATATLGVALQGLYGIDKLSVRVVPYERTRINIRCRPATPLGDLTRRLDQQAIARVRGVLGPSADLPVVIRLHVTRL